MVDERIKLPALATRDAASQTCAPEAPCTAYVSNEESAVLAAMRSLKRQAAPLKARLAQARGEGRPAADLAVVEAELAALREAWQRLADRREAAYRRKMVMLGHLPPGAGEE